MLKKIKDRIILSHFFKYVGLILCFILVETMFRVQPQMKSLFISPLDEVPILFDVLYSIIFATFIMSIPTKRLKKITFAIIYSLLSFFMFSEYIYCRIFGRVYGLKTLGYISEGGDFAASIWSYFDMSTLVLIICCGVLGVIGYLMIPEFPFKVYSRYRKRGFLWTVILSSLLGICLIPNMFQSTSEEGGFYHNYKKNVYTEWFDNKRAVSMFGAYEFLARDIYLTIRNNKISEDDMRELNNFFAQEKKFENDMTGIFEGKNLILVLMESMDDWLINENTTPTICKMCKEGINFTNMYTPIFGSAATLNSEFCSYTGFLAPPDGTLLANYTSNFYPYSLPRLFKQDGYSAKSFHYNQADFYNRMNLHSAVGFEEYISFLDYEEDEVAQKDDTLIKNSDVYSKLTEKAPFFDFVITFSAHSTIGSKAYSYEDNALVVYPEYIGMYNHEELESISAKARLTDDMFAGLLKRLEEDNLLKDTVIIAYTDHYDYMIVDQKKLEEVSGAENVYELSKTPFFIWAEGIEAQEISKVINTTDIYPTICNLFNLDNNRYFLGNDIFDDSYKGYAFWQDGSYILEEGVFYSSAGGLKGNISSEKQQEMQEMIKEKLKIDQLVMDTDYFTIEK